MPRPVALIFGITGQDGPLAERPGDEHAALASQAL